MYLNKLAKNLVKHFREEDLEIDNFSFTDLLQIILHRGIMYIRGKIYSIFFFGGKNLFIGKNVCLQGKHKIKFRGTSTIQSNCFISAIGADQVIIGKNFTFKRGSMIDSFGSLTQKSGILEIGDNCGFSENCHIAVRGNIQIGNDVIVGPGVKIFSENHSFVKDAKTRKLPSQRIGVKIGYNCWIGANAIILDGVIIGNNCVIAAGSVLTKSFKSNSIIAGVPAKILREI